MGRTYFAVGLLSAAALAFEITLTRLFSITQWYHFAFLAVSVALLGYGASGTALSLVPGWASPPTASRASTLAVLFSAAVIGAYLSLNYLPFDSYRIAWERIQILYLVLYYLALAVPFFCAGLVTGLLLAAHPGLTARVYAVNLLGAAAGGLLPVLALPLVGEGTVLVIAAVGLLASLTFLFRQRRILPTALLLAASGLLLLLSLYPPVLFQLQLSPYKGLSQLLRYPDAQVVWERWNAFSRVDWVASSSIRSAPGLSLSYPGQLPAQDGLLVDGDDLSPVNRSGDVAGFAGYLPTALPYRLRTGGRALVLEPRGGMEIQVALSQGAKSVVAVESNPLLIEAAGPVYADDGVRTEIEEARSYARRSDEFFDVVHLALSDTYRPVTSGAYSLGERYDLTVEAFEEYMARLQPGGLLVVERWLQLPPSEMLRAGSTAVEALRRTGVSEPADQMAVLRDWQVGLILVKNGVLTPDELAAIRRFAWARGLDLVALPGLEEEEANQFNVLEEPFYFRAFRQLLENPPALYASQSYDVRPPTDDQPFFFHFFKWEQTGEVLQQMGKTWQPWGGSGFLVLVALLMVAIAVSGALILLPLVLTRKGGKKLEGPRLRVLVYFGLLGMGFLFVELPLIQRFILFLGQPVYAFTAVVVSVLFFSGLGSLLSPRFSPPYSLPPLAVAILVYPLVLPPLFRLLLGAPLAFRVLVTIASLAPLGLLMGMPFPGGLAWLGKRAPGLVPWAWAINGCASVLASVLAAMVALSVGFTWVLVAAAVAYAGAWLVLR